MNIMNFETNMATFINDDGISQCKYSVNVVDMEWSKSNTLFPFFAPHAEMTIYENTTKLSNITWNERDKVIKGSEMNAESIENIRLE